MMNGEWKHTRTRQLIMVVFAFLGAIILISYGLIWNKYQREQSTQNNLNYQLDQVWPLVQAGELEAPDDQVERLQAARAELEEQKASFPTMLGTTDLMETLLDLAGEHNVDTALQTSQQPAGFGDGQYYILTSNVSATGSLENLIAFIQHLEDKPIDTLKLQQPINFTGSGNSWSANFSITVYSQSMPQNNESDQLDFEET